MDGKMKQSHSMATILAELCWQLSIPWLHHNVIDTLTKCGQKTKDMYVNVLDTPIKCGQKTKDMYANVLYTVTKCGQKTKDRFINIDLVRMPPVRLPTVI